MKAIFAEKPPDSYTELVKSVIEILSLDEGDPDFYCEHHPDPKRIHLIDDGDCQGTQVFVIAATGYQPSDYWYVKISYGSCSGCDALQGIGYYSDDEKPSESQVEQYMTLALHVVQGLKKMNDREEENADSKDS